MHILTLLLALQSILYASKTIPTKTYGALINTDGRDMDDLAESPCIPELESRRHHIEFPESRFEVIQRTLIYLSIGNLFRTIFETGLLSLFVITILTLPISCIDGQGGKMLWLTVLFSLGVDALNMLISIIHASVHGRRATEKAPVTAKHVFMAEAVAFLLTALRTVSASIPFGPLGNPIINSCDFIQSMWIKGNEWPAIIWIGIQLFPTAFLLVFYGLQMILFGSVLSKQTVRILESKELANQYNLL